MLKKLNNLLKILTDLYYLALLLKRKFYEKSNK